MKECWLFLKAKTNKNTVKHNKKSKPVGFKGGVTILYVYIYVNMKQQMGSILLGNAVNPCKSM